ncbi:MAG: T9SS type A sorting domain-containing protein [Bacteroidota bacterium]
MNKIITTLLLAVLWSSSFSQTFQWAKQVSGSQLQQVDGIAADAQGNIYVIGTFVASLSFDPTRPPLNSSSGSEIFFAKYSSSGSFIWGKALTGGLDDTGQDIAVDASGNIFITGQFGGTLDFGGTVLSTASNKNWAFIARYDNNGNLQWAKPIGTCGNCSSQGNGIALDNSGALYVGGEISPSININSAVADFGGVMLNPNVGGAWVASYFVDGNLRWAKNFGNNTADDTPAICKDVAVSSSGVFATGRFSTQNVDFDPGSGVNLRSGSNGNAYITKFTWGGDFSGATTLKIVPGSSGDSFGDTGEAVSADAFGNAYIVMSNGFNAPNQDIAFAKANPIASGNNFEFSHRIINENAFDGGYGIASESDGTFYISGSVRGRGININFNPGASTPVNVLVQQGRTDMVFAKYNSFGTCLYARAAGINGFGENVGESSVVSVGGRLVIGGRFQTAADFDPCYNAPTLTPISIDGFIASYRSADVAVGINGPGFVCGNLPYATYILFNVSPYASIVWSQSSNITTVSGSGTTSYTVQPGTGRFSNGNGYVQAAIQTSAVPGCAIPLQRRDVWVGTPDPYNNAKVSLSNQYGVNPVTLYPYAYNFTMDYVNGADSYLWSLPPGFSWAGPESFGVLASIRTSDIPGYYQLVCQPNNLCGGAGARYLGINIPGNGGQQMRAAYPNPSTTSFTVVLKEQPSTLEAEVSLLNKSTERVFREVTKESAIEIPTSNLPNGIYYPIVKLGGEYSNKQVIVQH